MPIIESPWERERTQALDVWASNGTLDGTLSWYSVNSYAQSCTGALCEQPPVVVDPWAHPCKQPDPCHIRQNPSYEGFPGHTRIR